MCLIQLQVSILARPFERALLRKIKGTVGRSLFQSSPALSSGRYGGRMRRVPIITGFNPRPPFRAGATRIFRHHGDIIRVSILARPFERALQPPRRNPLR